MTTTTTLANWYVIFPEGSAWVAIHPASGNRIEQANASTHIAAGDRYADICRAIAAGETDENVSPAVAEAVVSEWDADADAMCCVVERIVLED